MSASSSPSDSDGPGRWIAVILARAGSKGIKNKNIRDVAGKPLIAWSIEAALESEAFDEVWVSTDGDEIARVAEEYGAQVHRRSPITATDKASSDLALVEFALQHHKFDVIALIQCTSPLVLPEDYAGAKEAYLSEWLCVCDSLVTVHPEVKFFWTENIEDNPMVKPTNYDPKKRPRRQDAKKGEQLYNVENGAFYFTSRKALFNHYCRVGGQPVLYHIPRERAIDIDDEIDLQLAELYLKQRMRERGE
jgi:N-acylneuraminate cytidylyltransferase